MDTKIMNIYSYMRVCIVEVYIWPTLKAGAVYEGE